MTRRIAYCVVPESGGLFRFYRNLRAALAPHGWQVLAACMGPMAARRWDPAFADDGCMLLAPEEGEPKRQAQAFAAWVEDNHIDIVMPMDNGVAASAVRHLRPAVRLVTRCSSASDFGYRTTIICLERLSTAVAMTPRQFDGLSRFRRLPKERISLIPHGVDLGFFSCDRRSTTGPLERQFRIVYVGRLDDSTKGILWLPEIAAHLVRLGVEFLFDIIGDGQDRLKLTGLLQRNGAGSRCRLCGVMGSTEVARLLPAYDALVLPSRIEGFPNILAEAMAAGVVPVASRFRGVTDFIVTDSVTGLLCRVGDTRAFAEAIAGLARDGSRLSAMSKAARQAVEKRFSLDRMGRDYDGLFRRVLAEPPLAEASLPWSDFHIERAFKPGWRRYVPRMIKNIARQYLP
jgi:glycosyltransferase involved in cell wall biosynthesis